MRLICNPNIDKNKLETYLSTDIACLSLWSTDGLSWVSDEKVYMSEFNNIFESSGQEKVKDNGVFIETGGDGNFKVHLYINSTLSSEDLANLYKKHQGAHIVSSGKPFRLGSPEFVGYQDEYAISKNRVDTIEIPAGNYVVDVYSLLIKDDSGKPQYVQFAICLYSEAKYPNKEITINYPINSLKLKYSN